MTPSERIEAAARAMYEDGDQDLGPWAVVPVVTRLAFIRLAKAALASAYPELHADPPRAWVAPIDVTTEMRDAALAEIRPWFPRDLGDKLIGPECAIAQRVIDAMSTAHLSQPDTTKEKT